MVQKLEYLYNLEPPSESSLFNEVLSKKGINSYLFTFFVFKVVYNDTKNKIMPSVDF